MLEKISWLDLYNYLYDQAHDFDKMGKFNWQAEIVLHDAETGEEKGVNLFELDNKTVLTINSDAIFKK